MRRPTVAWEIQVDAENPQEAAEKAAWIMKNPSFPTMFLTVSEFSQPDFIEVPSA